nr:MAG TPA: hypothetical protein [Caudoviricetes sp.]
MSIKKRYMSTRTCLLVRYMSTKERRWNLWDTLMGDQNKKLYNN